MADNKPSFVVNGKTYLFPESLTMGEMCDAETQFGVEFGNNKTSGVRMVAAMLWIAIMRAEPKADPDEVVEAIRDLPPDVFETFQGMEDDAGPPEVTATRNGTQNDSGEPSSPTGEDQDGTHEAIGSLLSDIVAEPESTTLPT